MESHIGFAQAVLEALFEGIDTLFRIVCIKGQSTDIRYFTRRQVDSREFKDRYVEPLGPGADSFFLREERGKCVFLEHELGGYKTTCLVHPFKPSSCREWMPSLFRRECQLGLAKYWLTVTPSGQVHGSEEKLRDFYSLLRSLMLEEGCA